MQEEAPSNLREILTNFVIMFQQPTSENNSNEILNETEDSEQVNEAVNVIMKRSVHDAELVSFSLQFYNRRDQTL